MFDDRAHAGGKYGHFPWETLAEEKWPGKSFLLFRILRAPKLMFACILISLIFYRQFEVEEAR